MDKWLPIESAPRDAVILIRLEPKYESVYQVKAMFDGEHWISLEDAENFWEASVPTGWMPLPEPPKEDGDE